MRRSLLLLLNQKVQVGKRDRKRGFPLQGGLAHFTTISIPGSMIRLKKTPADIRTLQGDLILQRGTGNDYLETQKTEKPSTRTITSKISTNHSKIHTIPRCIPGSESKLWRLNARQMRFVPQRILGGCPRIENLLRKS